MSPSASHQIRNFFTMVAVSNNTDTPTEAVASDAKQVAVSVNTSIIVEGQKPEVEEQVCDERDNDEKLRTPDTETYVSEDEASELLERYGFGVGMRMYARSVALAALAGQQKAEKNVTVAESSPQTIEVPLPLSVQSFESVKSELSSKMAAKGSQPDENDDMVREQHIGSDDEMLIKSLDFSSLFVQAEEALIELFHQAEVLAAATHKTIFEDKVKNEGTKNLNKSKKWWFSGAAVPQIDRAVPKGNEEDLEEKGDATAEKWWLLAASKAQERICVVEEESGEEKKTDVLPKLKKWWTFLDPAATVEENKGRCAEVGKGEEENKTDFPLKSKKWWTFLDPEATVDEEKGRCAEVSKSEEEKKTNLSLKSKKWWSFVNEEKGRCTEVRKSGEEKKEEETTKTSFLNPLGTSTRLERLGASEESSQEEKKLDEPCKATKWWAILDPLSAFTEQERLCIVEESTDEEKVNREPSKSKPWWSFLDPVALENLRIPKFGSESAIETTTGAEGGQPTQTK